MRRRKLIKIYLAARFETRPALRGIRDALWEMGHEVVSTWLDEVKRPASMTEELFWKKLAMKDLTEIQSAELFILDTLVGSTRGGKEVEFGFALAQFQSKTLYIVGPLLSVFHTLCDRHFDTWGECLDALYKCSHS